MQSLSKLLASCMFTIEIVMLYFVKCGVRTRIPTILLHTSSITMDPLNLFLTLPIVIKLDCNF